MNSARDDSGHGTLVSSIAAENYVNQVSHFGYAKGIAMYKVLWRQGYEEADVLAAIENAIVDGVDVINISIAIANTTLLDDPISVDSFSAMQKGIVVSC